MELKPNDINLKKSRNLNHLNTPYVTWVTGFRTLTNLGSEKAGVLPNITMTTTHTAVTRATATTMTYG